MEIKWKVVPIQTWPCQRTMKPGPTPFSYDGQRGWRERGVRWSATSDLLSKELRFLGGRNVLLQMFVRDKDIRLDGWIRANASPTAPGVILSFDSKHGSLSYPCDAFSDWKSNVRAIAVALESLRRVDRYGVTRRGEQYTGWKAIPATTGAGSVPFDANRILAHHAGISVGDVIRKPLAAYRVALKRTHPDHGGDPEDFHLVRRAGQELGV